MKQSPRYICNIAEKTDKEIKERRDSGHIVIRLPFFILAYTGGDDIRSIMAN